jgi:hypothetical protein
MKRSKLLLFSFCMFSISCIAPAYIEQIGEFSLIGPIAIPRVMAYSGDMFAIVDGRTVNVFNAKEGNIVFTVVSDRRVTHVALSMSTAADGVMLAIARENYTIDVCNVNNSSLQSSLVVEGSITALAFSPIEPDSSLVIAATVRETPGILRWNAITGEPMATLVSECIGGTQLVFSPRVDGEGLIALVAAEGVYVLNANTGEVIRRLEEVPGLVTNLTFTQRRSLALIVEKDNLQIWDTESGKLTINMGGMLPDIAFSASCTDDGSTVFARVMDDSSVRIFKFDPVGVCPNCMMREIECACPKCPDCMRGEAYCACPKCPDCMMRGADCVCPPPCPDCMMRGAGCTCSEPL